MANSLKTQIVIQTLVPFVAAYIILCAVRAGSEITDILKDWQNLLAVGILSVGLSLFQDLIPRSVKEFLVFWRRKERLPSFRAFQGDRKFSELLTKDDIVDFGARGTLSPSGQYKVFYALYDKFRSNGAVAHYSFRYLQWRELAVTSLVAAIIVLVRFIQVRGWTSTLPYELFAYGILVYIISVIASRNASAALVDHVLLAEKVDRQDVIPK